MDSFAALKAAVDTAELVDGHAHNIVALDSTFSYLNCFTEATEAKALSFAPRSIPFMRSLREIAQPYGIDSSLEVVQEYREKSGVESVTSRCFEASGISAILIDDGIDLDKSYGIEWHKNFAPFVGRILRIERVAEKILLEGIINGVAWSLDSFTELFVNHLTSSVGEIVGFKSIAAYRSGLKINPDVSKKEAEEGLKLEVLRAGSTIRITNKNFIDYIFVKSLEIAQLLDLPLQIHTGFGDKDLDLREANPLHLRRLLEDKRFKKCRIVLLHSSYPYSREASYLASVHHQVYLDFGLAVPKLSFHGMVSSVKELLHLAPVNKVMFSTDGVGFAESFYLGAKNGRKVIFSVLRDACADGDLSITEAVQAAKEILSENAKRFYKIETSRASFNLHYFMPAADHLSLSQHGIEFVRVLCVDSAGQHRCRVVPRRRFHDVIVQNGLGLACAVMGMPSHTDSLAEGSNLSAVGEIRLMPDLSTKVIIPWTRNQEMVLAEMHLTPGIPWEYCPIYTLQRLTKLLKDEFDLVLNAGFENEFYLLRNEKVHGEEKWLPFDHTPYCSSSSIDIAFPLLSEIADCLHSLNIVVEQLHAEAGNGQFEVALGYTNCKSAADKLIFTREVIRAVARKYGLLATFAPKYSLQDVGSGSHVHLSLYRNGQNVFMGQKSSSRYGISTLGEEFMAGVLNHLPSILAFTAPVPNSYDRLQPNTWSGAYHCWGIENREAPIRAASPPGTPFGSVSNFEIKAFDGCANPYLGLAAIIAAGIDGLRKHLALPAPIDGNPDAFKDKVTRLPKCLAESVQSLEKDSIMTELIGEKLLVAIKAIRKAEVKHYSENKDDYKHLIYRF